MAATPAGAWMKYEPSLDGLRAVAVLAVMGFHFCHGVVSGGSLGVDVFFVLSGYLITSILAGEIERRGTLDYRAFLMRRARRLLPALGVLLIAYAILSPLLCPGVAARRWLDVATAVFYVTNLRETFWPANTPLSHTWSLAIEEQFYLLWPFAVLALARFDRRRSALILCAAWAALTFARLMWAETIGGPGAYYLTPLHATGLILGAALALRPIDTSTGRVALVGLGALFIAGDTSSTFLATQPVAEIAAVLVIANPPRLLTLAPLRFLGRISYGVYLWHIPLYWLVLPASWSGICVLVAATVLSGWLSHLLVERRFLARAGPADRHTRSAASQVLEYPEAAVASSSR
jgi:peptidoglycan/LPS O-acetylase OafA/YrhL